MFHPSRTERADQLVLQVGDADEETQRLHLDAGQVGAEAGAPEAAPEGALLGRIAESRQPDVVTARSEQFEEASDVRRTTDRHDRDAFSAEIPAAPFSERFECQLVAHAFDEHDRAAVEAGIVDGVRCARGTPLRS